jgi:hypothetical protein
MYHVGARPCLQESGIITLSWTILIQFLCHDHDKIASFHLVSNYSFTSLLIEIQTRYIVRHNTSMLYSNVLYVLAYQNHHQATLLQKFKNISTFATLTLRGPCIVIYSYNKSQQDALFLNFILVKNSTCFGRTYCPSSGVWIRYSQQLVFVILVMLCVC